MKTRIVAVLFAGNRWSGSSDIEKTGVNALKQTLSDAFDDSITARVFGYSEHSKAHDFVEGELDRNSIIVLIGHSVGGDSVLEVACDELEDQTVHLTIQIDPVGVANNRKPDNVKAAINYYDKEYLITADYVVGAANVEVEDIFNDTTITHTRIDDDLRLHGLIVQDINSIATPTDLVLQMESANEGIITQIKPRLPYEVTAVTTLTTTYKATKIAYEATNSITAAGSGTLFHIRCGEKVVFKAGKRIILSPGFKAELTSAFRAKTGEPLLPVGWSDAVTGPDAAVWWSKDRVYFFKGDQYIRYTPSDDKVDPGYPKITVDHWPRSICV